MLMTEKNMVMLIEWRDMLKKAIEHPLYGRRIQLLNMRELEEVEKDIQWLKIELSKNQLLMCAQCKEVA